MIAETGMGGASRVRHARLLRVREELASLITRERGITVVRFKAIAIATARAHLGEMYP